LPADQPPANARQRFDHNGPYSYLAAATGFASPVFVSAGLLALDSLCLLPPLAEESLFVGSTFDEESEEL
jgi:hypothetical protein